MDAATLLKIISFSTGKVAWWGFCFGALFYPTPLVAANAGIPFKPVRLITATPAKSITLDKIKAPFTAALC